MVIALIAILAGLLLPSISRGKSRARAAECLNNLRQIGIASRMYADDNDELLPQSSHEHASWVGTLQAYLGGTSVFRCPVDSNRQRLYSYAINDYLTTAPSGSTNQNFSRITAVPAPASTLYMAECQDDYEGSDHFHFADEADGGYTPPAFIAQVAAGRHGVGANYLFVDTHVEFMSWSAVKPKLQEPGGRLVRPGGNP